MHQGQVCMTLVVSSFETTNTKLVDVRLTLTSGQLQAC
jgi:hypothetical protein